MLERSDVTGSVTSVLASFFYVTNQVKYDLSRLIFEKEHNLSLCGDHYR